MITYPDIGRERMAQTLFGAEGLPLSINLKLFVNDKTPAVSDLTGDYVEMSTLSYAAIPLTPGTDTEVDLTAGVVGITFKDMTFVFTTGTPVTVYGWYLVIDDNLLSTVFAAERFTNPITVSQNGDQIKVSAEMFLNQG